MRSKRKFDNNSIRKVCQTLIAVPVALMACFGFKGQWKKTIKLPLTKQRSSFVEGRRNLGLTCRVSVMQKEDVFMPVSVIQDQLQIFLHSCLGYLGNC
jgi:hypothetical protein